MSTVFRGTTFENRCLRILESTFRGMTLRRIGGKDDGGVDILGWWDLPCKRRLRILAQCKAEKKKSAPRYIREMEGVAMVYRAGLSAIPFDDEADAKPSASNIVAFLLSESPFTKATLLRALKSPVPLMLLHVPPLNLPPEDEPSAANVTLLPDSELKVEVGAGEGKRFGIWQGSTRL
ncbi:hypothetical protein BDZ89DRAFT_1078111 [Hymenopellis radicata]|nr:hypothetical protein BDZ89DRAFT_1078111 [Hymenopellis radicata]